VWTARSRSGDVFAAFFNLGEKDSVIEVPLAKLGMTSPVRARDLWKRTAQCC
jgi:hypothetical protein